MPWEIYLTDEVNGWLELYEIYLKERAAEEDGTS